MWVEGEPTHVIVFPLGLFDPNLIFFPFSFFFLVKSGMTCKINKGKDDFSELAMYEQHSSQ